MSKKKRGKKKNNKANKAQECLDKEITNLFDEIGEEDISEKRGCIEREYEAEDEITEEKKLPIKDNLLLFGSIAILIMLFSIIIILFI